MFICIPISCCNRRFGCLAMWLRSLISKMFKVKPHPYCTRMTCHYKSGVAWHTVCTSLEPHRGGGMTWKLGDPLLYLENQGYIHNPTLSFVFVLGRQTTYGRCYSKEGDNSPFNLVPGMSLHPPQDAIEYNYPTGYHRIATVVYNCISKLKVSLQNEVQGSHALLSGLREHIMSKTTDPTDGDSVVPHESHRCCSTCSSKGPSQQRPWSGHTPGVLPPRL